jgi:ATP-binding cassette subfamily B protein
LCVCSVLSRGAAAVIPVGVLWVAKRILDEVVLLNRHERTSPERVWRLLMIEFALVVAGDIINRVTNLCDALLGDRFTQNVNVRLLEHANSLDLETFESPAFHDRLERARSQASSRLGVFSNIAQCFQQTATLTSLLMGMVFFAPSLVLLQAAAVVPVVAAEARFAALLYRLFREQTTRRRELEYLMLLGTSDSSVREVRVFGLGDYLLGRYRKLAVKLFQESASLSRRRALVGAVLTALGTAAYYGGYVVIVRKTLSGALTIGGMVFLAGSFQRAKSEIQGIFSLLTRTADQALYLNHIIEFFGLKPRIVSPPNPLPAPRPIRIGLEFCNTMFQYTAGKSPVLRGVSFRIEAGEHVALVGENGAGKTTLIKLIARLYDPTAGRVLLDGVDLREYDMEDLRSQMSIVLQDFVRYEFPVSDNIGLGSVADRENRRKIELAAQKAGASELISGLPKGFDQMLGKRFAGGIELSGGQWQKLALARASMRDAQLIILDEPTAALDPRAEHAVFEEFMRLTTGRTAILISHRFSTVRMADRILVLEDGRIIEQGDHTRLLRHGGRYAELFTLQAAAYR